MAEVNILLFGESQNDIDFLKFLIPALIETSVTISYNRFRSPTILSSGSSKTKRQKMASLIAGIAEQFEKVGRKVIVVAHRDTNTIEPAHISEATSLENDLRIAGVRIPIAAVASWCVESWWFNFPDEVSQVRPCWAKLKGTNAHVGIIVNAKARFREALKPRNSASCPEYRESDSEKIARNLVGSGRARWPRQLRSQSLTLFRDKLRNNL